MAVGTPSPEDLAALVGVEFPDGSFTIDPADHRRAVSIFHLDRWESPAAHPAYGHIALNSGMGIGREEFFALCGATLRTGALFGRGVITFHRPLMIGATYAISSRITGAERKSGRRSGTFDLVTVGLGASDATGVACVEMDETYVFLRGDGDA